MFRSNKTWRVFAVAATAALALSACGTTKSSSNGSSGESCKGDYKIGFFGAETGPAGALGQNMVGGVKLALSEFKVAGCNVTLADFDSQGNPANAPDLAQKAIDDAKIIGIVGPGFSGETLAVGDKLFQAGLPNISPSATNYTITQKGWKTFFRVIGNDLAQGKQDAKYLSGKKVFAISDDTDYGKGLVGVFNDNIGSAGVGKDQVTTGQTDFSATVTKVLGSGADTVFYAGYYPEAGLLLKQLKAKGFAGTFLGTDGVQDGAFNKAAGDAATGALFSAPAGPPDASFNTKYKAVNGVDSGLYSEQAYDATNVFLAALKAGKTTRADIAKFIPSYTTTGASGPIAFDDKGDIKESVIYVYKDAGGSDSLAVFGDPQPIK